MKKKFVVSIVITILLCLYPLSHAAAEGILRENTDKDKPKIISVIFDDSGSMVGKEDEKERYTTRWVDADYAIKALAVMMNPEDQLRLYAMSDYTTDAHRDMDVYNVQNKKDVISALGEKMSGKPCSSNTYFYPLEAAWRDFSTDDIEKYECWIVVLTDGVFNTPEDLDAGGLTFKLNALIQPSSGNGSICVAYIPIEDDAVELTDKADSRIVQISQKEDITHQITELLNRIYKRVRMNGGWTYERLSVKDDKVVLKTDVPMEKLVIFLQYQGEEENYLEHEKKGREKITILDESKELDAPKYLKLENEIQFSGKDERPIGDTFELELVKYHTLQGAILTWKYNSYPQLGASEFKDQTFTIPIQSGCDIIAEVYYQPAVRIGYDYLQDGELVEHKDCKFTGRPMEGTEYCLHEGEMGISLKLLDSQGETLLEQNSPFLYPDEFRVSLIPVGQETGTELQRSGEEYSYIGQILEEDYEMRIQTPWNEVVTQNLSVQERRKSLEIVPIKTQIIFDTDDKEHQQLQILVKEEGEILLDEAGTKVTVICTVEDQEDVTIGSPDLESDGTYAFPVSLKKPEKDEIAGTAIAHIEASRAYNRGSSEMETLDVELELTSRPHSIEAQCEVEEMDALSCILHDQRFDVKYMCDEEELEKEKLENLEAYLTVDGEDLNGLFKIGPDKNLVACASPKWWSISEQECTMKLEAAYVKHNKRDKSNPLLIQFWIRPVPRAFKIFSYTVLSIVALWGVSCVVKLFTPYHVRKKQFVMNGEVISFDLKLKRKRNLFLPLYRNARLVMKMGGNNGLVPIPNFEMVIRNGEGRNGYMLSNYESFKNSEIYQIGGLPITKNNRIFNNERCFKVKNTFGEMVELHITDRH